MPTNAPQPSFRKKLLRRVNTDITDTERERNRDSNNPTLKDRWKKRGADSKRILVPVTIARAKLAISHVYTAQDGRERRRSSSQPRAPPYLTLSHRPLQPPLRLFFRESSPSGVHSRP